MKCVDIVFGVLDKDGDVWTPIWALARQYHLSNAGYDVILRNPGRVAPRRDDLAARGWVKKSHLKTPRHTSVRT